MALYAFLQTFRLFFYPDGGDKFEETNKTLRRTAHHYFDQLYQSGMMSKQDAYQWLADLICAPLSEAHIGYLGEYYCKQVIEESRKLLEQRNVRRKQVRFREIEGGVAVCF